MVVSCIKSTENYKSEHETDWIYVFECSFLQIYWFRLAYHVAGLLTKHCYKIIYSKVGDLLYGKTSKAIFKKDES